MTAPHPLVDLFALEFPELPNPVARNRPLGQPDVNRFAAHPEVFRKLFDAEPAIFNGHGEPPHGQQESPDTTITTHLSHQQVCLYLFIFDIIGCELSFHRQPPVDGLLNIAWGARGRQSRWLG
jgi:hypothetical protein